MFELCSFVVLAITPGPWTVVIQVLQRPVDLHRTTLVFSYFSCFLAIFQATDSFNDLYIEL